MTECNLLRKPWHWTICLRGRPFASPFGWRGRKLMPSCEHWHLSPHHFSRIWGLQPHVHHAWHERERLTGICSGYWWRWGGNIDRSMLGVPASEGSCLLDVDMSGGTGILQIRARSLPPASPSCGRGIPTPPNLGRHEVEDHAASSRSRFIREMPA